MDIPLVPDWLELVIGTTLGWALIAWHRSRMRWRVRIRPHPGGVIFYIKKGLRRYEVGRVGFKREKTTNPAMDFNEAFGMIMSRAKERASQINAAERHK